MTTTLASDVSSAQDPYDWETYPASLALTKLVMHSSPVFGGTLTRENEARHLFSVVAKRTDSASMLDLLNAVPAAEDAIARWQFMPDGWVARIVVDGRIAEPAAKWKRGETWESRQQAELRKHTVISVVHVVAPGMVHRVAATKDETTRTLRAFVAWHDVLSAEQSEVLRASLEWWLGLWVWRGWSVALQVRP